MLPDAAAAALVKGEWSPEAAPAETAPVSASVRRDWNSVKPLFSHVECTLSWKTSRNKYVRQSLASEEIEPNSIVGKFTERAHLQKMDKYPKLQKKIRLSMLTFFISAYFHGGAFQKRTIIWEVSR